MARVRNGSSYRCHPARSDTAHTGESGFNGHVRRVPHHQHGLHVPEVTLDVGLIGEKENIISSGAAQIPLYTIGRKKNTDLIYETS